MIYLDEIRLQLADARTTYQSQHPTQPWSDWYAEYMHKNGLAIEPDELGTLLREADVAYHQESEQHPWLDYVSKHIFLSLKQ